MSRFNPGMVIPYNGEWGSGWSFTIKVDGEEFCPAFRPPLPSAVSAKQAMRDCLTALREGPCTSD